MITSFVQYLLMAPSYITVLNVYAVSITSDDVGSSLTSSSLPTFTMSRGVPRETTRSLTISEQPPSEERTRTKSKSSSQPNKRISTRHMRMPFTCWLRNHPRSSRSGTLVRSKRIITRISGRMCCWRGPCRMDCWALLLCEFLS